MKNISRTAKFLPLGVLIKDIAQVFKVVKNFAVFNIFFMGYL
jgi:hypothetical protein